MYRDRREPAASELALTRFPEAPKAVSERTPRGDRMMLKQLALAVLLIGSAWAVGRFSGFTSGSDLGYWLGVAGGVAMLLLFIYPLRKHWKAMRHIGNTKPWFIAHMILGITGPWIILVHSTFHLGSLNATVALVSMMVVALSGVIGRFLYVKVHVGLDDERAALVELRAQWEAGHKRWDAMIEAAPAVKRTLAEFEQHALAPVPFQSAWAAWRRVRRLRHDADATIEACRPLLDEVLARMPEPTAPRERRRQLHHWRFGVREHVGQVLKVAQFSAWERLFALWHVAHVPFVYVMVICAFAHVFAVHAY